MGGYSEARSRGLGVIMGACFYSQSELRLESFEQRRPCSDLNGQDESGSCADSRLKRGGDRGGKAKPRQGKMVACTGVAVGVVRCWMCFLEWR